jgi:integrase
MPLGKLSKDALRPWIESRYDEKVSARTVNWGLEAVRRILRLAAFHWRDEGIPWIQNAPIVSMEKGPALQPYPLSWDEQDALFALLSDRMRDLCLYAVNTGCRDQEITRLRWEWEKDVGIGESVFVLPASVTKTTKPYYVVLNSEARRVVQRWRGEHETYVFGEPVHQLTNKVWQRAWAKVIGDVPGYRKGAHNLRHTFGKRLRDEGVADRDVADLLHHMPKSITRHYSQPELKNLRACVERIVRKPQLRAVG